MMLRQRDFPRTFLVRDTQWQVKFVRNVPATTTEGRVVLGLCEPETCTIYVKLGLGPITRLEVFLHEALHCIEHEYDIVIDHKLIEKLEQPLRRIILDNIKPMPKAASA